MSSRTVICSMMQWENALLGVSGGKGAVIGSAHQTRLRRVGFGNHGLSFRGPPGHTEESYGITGRDCFLSMCWHHGAGRRWQ